MEPDKTPEPPSRLWPDLLRAALAAAIPLAGVLAFKLPTVPFTDQPNPLAELAQIDRLAELAADVRHSAWGPFVFVIVYVLVCVFAGPAGLLTMLSGAVFGFAQGLLLTWIGANLGAAAAFGIARSLGRGPVERRAGKWLAWLDERVRDYGFLTILYSRLLWIPFTPVNYAAGVTAVRFRDFMLGTALGILPASSVLVYFADSLIRGEGVQAYINIALATAAMILMSLIPWGMGRWLGERGKPE